MGMNGFRRILGMSLAGLTVLAPAARSAGKTAETPWEAVSAGAARIAVPRGWRSLDNMRPNMLVFREGNGIGVPIVDETDAPLQIGLIVEKLPASKQSVADIMKGLVNDAKAAPRLELVGKESVTPVRLSDGTEAMLLRAEFLKQGLRRSLQMKLVAKDADANAWIVSGHLVGGRKSQWPTPDSPWAKWLEAHLTSFTLDEKKLDVDKLTAAYRARPRL